MSKDQIKKQNKILITGANSFVGQSYMKFSRFEFVKEVCLLENQPENIDFSGIDAILHVAGIVHQGRGISESEYYLVNRDLSVRIAVLAKKRGVKHFVFLSTVKVYGTFISGSAPWNESSTCNPEDAYGKSKFEAETELKNLESDDFIVSIVRTPLVYGSGVRANMLKIMRMVDRFPVLPLGGIQNKRHFTYVENLVQAIDQVIEKKASGTYIAMDDESISTTSLVRVISDALNKKRVLFGIPNFIVKAGLVLMPRIFDRLYGSFELDNSRTKTEIGYNPKLSTVEGISRTVKQIAT